MRSESKPVTMREDRFSTDEKVRLNDVARKSRNPECHFVILTLIAYFTMNLEIQSKTVMTTTRFH